jgi:DNA-binding response OmpR family regulator
MHVLLIDKQQPLITRLARGLEEQGFDVTVASDGTAGDDKVHTDDYHAIVLDLTLANGDGPLLLRRWCRARAQAAVFVLTNPEHVTPGMGRLDLGAGQFLTVPFEPEDLFTRLRALSQRSQQETTTTLRIYDLEIDTVARTVKRQERLINLTPREYDLLEFLARHQGRVVTRSIILKHLYDEQETDMSNVVDVYIRYLRRKIDKGFEPPLILTRWGQGYLLRSGES